MAGLEGGDRPVGASTTPTTDDTQTPGTNGSGNGHPSGNGRQRVDRAAVVATPDAPPAAAPIAPALPTRPRTRPTAPRVGRRRIAHPVTVEESPARAADFPAEERAGRSLFIPIALGFVLVLAVLLRIAAARILTPQADEPASVLAAHQVAHRGVPILPSGTLYLHGATLSYLLAPFVWAGYGDLDDLLKMRMVSVFFGVVAVGLTYLLAKRVTGAAWVGILAAFFLAIDPVSVEWSSYVRMYTVLQTATVASLLFFLSLLVKRQSRLVLGGFVACFWLAIFSHVGAALIWPGLVGAAFAVHGRDLFRKRRDLVLALGGALLAPFTISVLNLLLQPKNYRPLTNDSFFSFAGEGLFNLERLRTPRATAWTQLFGNGKLSNFLPLVFIALCGIVIGSFFLQKRAVRFSRAAGDGRRVDDITDSVGHERRVMVGALLAAYWGAVILVCLFTYEQKPRYLLQVQPLTYVLTAAAIALLLQQVGRAVRGVSLFAGWQRWVPQSIGASLTVVMTIFVLGSGLGWRFANPMVDTDHIEAMEYIMAHRQPGELVIAALPAAPYLEMGSTDDLMFLAGAEGTKRVERYTRIDKDGRVVDYWVGADSIVSASQLCQVLIANPDAWIIVDTDRLTEIWAFGGPMREYILRMTDLVAELTGEVLIYHHYVAPSGDFDRPTCGGREGVPPDIPPPAAGRYRRG